MASNGSHSIAVTAYDTLKFSWWQISQNAGFNTTTIGWKLELIAGSAGKIISSGSKAATVYVDGKEFRLSVNVGIENNTTKVLASNDNTVITHNADGTKTFSYDYSVMFGAINFNGTTIGTKRAYSSGTLNPIARKATFIEAQNFTDAENPYIAYANSAGNSVTSLQACVADTSNNVIVSYRDIYKTGSSYQFVFTEAERKALRKYAKKANVIAVRFFLKTIINGSTHYDYIQRNLSIVNAMPTIAPTVYDVGGVSTQLTGNPNIMIKYFNHIKTAINSTAYKEATIDKNYIKCGENYVEQAAYDFLYVDSNYFKFTAVDSRGNQVSKEITLPMIDYIPFTCEVEADIALDTADSTKAIISFTVKGDYFSGSFGAVDNTLTIDYILEDNLGVKNTYSLAIPADAIDGGKYEVAHTINNLNYKNSYTVTIEAKDKIATINKTTKTLKAVPVFDWSETDFNFNVPVAIDNRFIDDFVTEQGTSNGWYYRKWKSGKGECWKTLTINTAINVGWGGVYAGATKMARQNYPFVFKSKPMETASVTTGSNAVWVFAESGGNGVNGAYASAIYNVCRPTAITTAADYYITIYAIGTL